MKMLFSTNSLNVLVCLCILVVIRMIRRRIFKCTKINDSDNNIRLKWNIFKARFKLEFKSKQFFVFFFYLCQLVTYSGNDWYFQRCSMTIHENIDIDPFLLRNIHVNLNIDPFFTLIFLMKIHKLIHIFFHLLPIIHFFRINYIFYSVNQIPRSNLKNTLPTFSSTCGFFSSP